MKINKVLIVGIITLMSIIGVSFSGTQNPYQKVASEFLTGISEVNVDKVAKYIDQGKGDPKNVSEEFTKELEGLNNDYINKYGEKWIKNISVKIEEDGDKATVYIKTKEVKENIAFTIYKNGDKYTVDL